MEITSASQQFAVAEQKTVAYGRKQQLLSKPTQAETSTATPARNTQPVIAMPEIAADHTEHEPDLQTDDDVVFNAFQTVGMVKRILAQLSSHNASYLDNAAITQYSGTASVSQQLLWLTGTEQNTDNSQQWLATTEWEIGYQSLQAAFSGELTLQNGETFSYAFEFSMEYSWASYSYTEQQLNLQDPLVISLNGMPAKLDKETIEFDLFNTGVPVQLPNLAAQQFYLAYDKDNNGNISSGAELFGPLTGQGFTELSAHDLDANGFIDQQDAIWQSLYLWRPDGQQLTMQQAGIGAVSVNSAATAMPLHNSHGELNAMLQRSSVFLHSDGRAGLVQQIDLKV